MNHFKTFKNFEDGIVELRKVVPGIAEYIGSIDSFGENESTVVINMMDKLKESFPSINNIEYPATYALNVSATEVSFKTRGFYGFGWRVNPQNGVYSFRISFNDNNSSIIKTKTEALLSEKGWRLSTPKPPHNKYVSPAGTKVPESVIDNPSNATQIGDSSESFVAPVVKFEPTCSEEKPTNDEASPIHPY